MIAATVTRWSRPLGTVGLAALVGLAGAWRGGPLAPLDDRALDALLAHLPAPAFARRAVVVDIDDASLAAVGQWPWPRYRVGALIERVAAAKPAAIALDVLFPEEDRTSIASVRQAFRDDFGVDIAFTGVPAGLGDNDGYLGEVMARTRTIGASYFYFDHATGSGAPPRPALGVDGRTELLALPEAPGLLANTDAIAARTRLTGFVNMRADDDGVLRRLPLLMAHAGVVHGSLALAAAMQAVGVRAATVEADARGLALRFGAHRVPVDAHGEALLRPRAAGGGAANLPAVEVLGAGFRPDDLRGKVVIIGASPVGLGDVHRTATDARYPGARVQADMVDALLSDGVIGRPAWAGALSFALCVGAGLLLGLLALAGAGPAVLAGAGVGVAVAAVGASALLLRADLYVSPVTPVLATVLLLASAFVLRAHGERRRLETMRRQLENARQVAIESMAAVAETRDPETGAHIKRTQHYVRAIACELRRTGHHPALLTDEYVDLLFVSAPLHDIGKVGVPDHILLKPGRLTPDEMTEMRLHADMGRRIVDSSAGRIHGDNFLAIAGQIAATHHERWDGMGYPLGLAGEAIPLAGRIMSVADVYDALISRRCYKEPFPHAHAVHLMHEQRGTAFDPDVLDAFFRIEAEIRAIAARYRDEDEPEVEPTPAPAPVPDVVEAG